MNAKLDVGGVLTRVFGLYGTYLNTLLGIGAIIFIPLGVIEGILQSGGGVVLTLAGTAISLVGTGLFVGAVTRLVEDVDDGRLDAGVGGLISSVTPVLVTLIVVSVLAGIAEAIGFLLIIIPGIFLVTAWSVISPVVVIESASVGAAFGRSWALVKSNFWQVLAVIILFFVIQAVAGAILAAILLAISDTTVLRIIATIIAQLALAPLSALAAAVIYFQLVGLERGVPVAQAPLPDPPPPPPPAAPQAPPPPPPV